VSSHDPALVAPSIALAAESRAGKEIFVFAHLLQFIRAKTRSRAVLVGGVAAAAITVAIAGSPVLALVRGHGTSGAGSLTSLVRPDAPGVQGHGAADSSKAAGPNGTGQGGSQKTTCPTGGVPAPGSTVNGGLVVDGNCTITHVTVNGGS
jgi:hypothetical protein